VTSEGRRLLDRRIYPDMSRAVLPLIQSADEGWPDKTRIQILLGASEMQDSQLLSDQVVEQHRVI
jgi:hypothetical protein